MSYTPKAPTSADPRRRSTVLVVVTVLACLILASGALAPPALAAGGVAGDDDDEPPEIPASYYGEVTIDGEPAPEGTVVTALVDGEVIASIVVEAPGRFGGPTIDDEKLRVPNAGDDGTVTFRVNGEAADATPATIEWESGDHRRVELIADADARDDPVVPAPPAPDPGDADIRVTAAEPSATAIETGGSITVTATVTNRGETAGTARVSLSIDGATSASRTVSLRPGETTTVTFDETFADPGSYVLSIDGAEVIVTVGDAALRVTDADLEASALTVGDVISVGVTAENRGDRPGERTFELRLDGEPVGSTTVELAPGETASFDFEHAVDRPGTYEVGVDDTVVGTVTVESAENGDSIPGFGAVAAALALIGISIAGRRTE